MNKTFIYFGTPEVARETLATLLASGFTPALVVTAPDAPKGRGLVLTPSPVKALALEKGLAVITPETLDEVVIEEITRVGADYALCVAYGKIFPEPLINAFPQGVLNVHYSLLPRHRGATPLEAALLAGDRETGVTVQKMVKALDAGAIVAQERVAIGENETARELRPRLITRGAELLVSTLPNYLNGDVTLVEQDASLATFCHKLKKEDGELDLSGDALTNWNKYRAYADSIGTFFMESGRRNKITAASFKNLPAQAGGAFTVERVIPEGKTERAY